MNLTSRLKNRILRWGLPLPFHARHIEYSIIASVDDEVGRPNQRLLDIALDAVGEARKMDLAWLSRRMAAPPYYPEIWPGEHYRLLAALVARLKPRRVVEIGTFTGLSALAMKGSLPPGGEVVTVDIVPWDQINGTAFQPADFADGQLRQFLGDLSQPEVFAGFADTLAGCSLLFVDAPKNVLFETAFLKYLGTLHLPAEAIVVFDDIRQWNMLKIWREIPRPKLDLTAFGHWTGTGLIDWNGMAASRS